MEEQRIGMMYWNSLKNGLRRRWDGLFPRGLGRSRALPLLIIAAVIIIPSVGYYLHMHGRFIILKRKIGVEQPIQAAYVARPGGSEPLVLSRAQTMGTSVPEFLSATILPGLGMDIVQITASLPGRGETPLLMAPTIKELTDNTVAPRSGPNDNHGGLELPWSGSVTGLISPIGSSLTTAWKGQTLSVTRDAQERAGIAEGGMIATQGADTSAITMVPMGTLATGEYKSTDFDGHWPSKTDVSVSAQLGPRTLDITVTARNVGTDAQPMGIGWHPRFTIPSGNREGAEIRLPMGEKLEIADHVRSTPSGHIVPAGEPASKFMGRSEPLGGVGVDEMLVHLKPALMDSGSAAEFRDPSSGFGLRLTAVSTSIKELRVVAPAGSPYVSFGMQTNFDDALGKQWTGPDGSGLVTLLPGQSIEWKVRLEIFNVARH